MNNLRSNSPGCVLPSKDGAQIDIANADEGDGASSMKVFIKTPNADDYDNIAPLETGFNLSAASGKVDIAEDTTNVNVKYVTPSIDTNLRQRYTSLGAFVNWKTVSNDPDSLEIDYPVNGQRLPIVTVTAPGAEVKTIAASEAGQITYYETTPIAVGTAVLAEEAGDDAARF